MNPILNNSSYIEAVNSAIKTNFIGKVYNPEQQNAESTDTNLNQNAKNAIVSENAGNNSIPAAYNYQFQANVPLSKLLTTGRAYNETVKPFISKDESSEDSSVEDYYEPSTTSENSASELSYYIVDNNLVAVAGNSSLRKETNLLRQKINKAYHLGSNVEPGSLVNITYY
jgi:hypothetical protein